MLDDLERFVAALPAFALVRDRVFGIEGGPF